MQRMGNNYKKKINKTLFNLQYCIIVFVKTLHNLFNDHYCHERLHKVCRHSKANIESEKLS